METAQKPVSPLLVTHMVRDSHSEKHMDGERIPWDVSGFVRLFLILTNLT